MTTQQSPPRPRPPEPAPDPDARDLARIAEALDRLTSRDPDPEDPDAALIARIEAVTKAARANWFWFFGIQAFSALALMGMRDVDFFSTSATTTLPIIAYDVPIVTFVFVAPLLIAIVYTYMHGIILRLWYDLGRLPPVRNGEPLVASLPIWMVLDFALLIRRWRSGLTAPGTGCPAPFLNKSLLGVLGACAMAALVWVTGPLLVGGFWWRSHAAHMPWLTHALGLALWASLVVMALSLRAMVLSMGLQARAVLIEEAL